MLINKELYNEYFTEDRADNFINMDIEIFDTLNNMMDAGELKNTPHKVFTFGYLWLTSYLWKYSKYSEQKIGVKEIKKILGLPDQEKRVDYIIKKNGVLDTLGYTETTRDFPIHTRYSQTEGIVIESLSSLEKGVAKEFLKQYGNHYNCKKPLFQYDSTSRTPLLYSREDTLPISMLEFTRIVFTPELGLDAFYVYCYLKLRNKLNGYIPVCIMHYELEKDIGFERRKIRSIIQKLSEVNLVKVESEIRRVEDGNTINGQLNKYSVILVN